MPYCWKLACAKKQHPLAAQGHDAPFRQAATIHGGEGGCKRCSVALASWRGALEDWCPLASLRRGRKGQ
eukprot:12723246-Alexandrium_andersonii.AAC.1